jgi:hypothetical protein
VSHGGFSVSIAPESDLARPVRQIRTFRYWGISVAYVGAVLVTVVALALCVVSTFLAKALSWNSFIGLFSGGASGGLGAWLRKADERESADVDQRVAIDWLVMESDRHPEDTQLRQKVVDLQLQRATGKRVALSSASSRR